MHVKIVGWHGMSDINDRYPTVTQKEDPERDCNSLFLLFHLFCDLSLVPLLLISSLPLSVSDTSSSLCTLPLIFLCNPLSLCPPYSTPNPSALSPPFLPCILCISVCTDNYACICPIIYVLTIFARVFKCLSISKYPWTWIHIRAQIT